MTIESDLSKKYGDDLVAATKRMIDLHQAAGLHPPHVAACMLSGCTYMIGITTLAVAHVTDFFEGDDGKGLKMLKEALDERFENSVKEYRDDHPKDS